MLGSGWQGQSCVKNLPRVGAERSVQNLVEIGSGGSCVKEGHRYKQSFIYR